MFKRLLNYQDTAGIIFDWRLDMTVNENVYVVDSPSVDGIVDFIKDSLSLFNYIIIYSNYPSSKIKPYIKTLKNLENETDTNFVVMYRRK